MFYIVRRWRECCLVLVSLTLALSCASATEPDGATLYFYASPTTDDYMKLQGKSYANTIKRWRPYLKKYGDQVREITRQQLLSGLTPGVLILPTAIALDAQERRAIEQFAAQGGSILGNGLIGTLDAQGQPAGIGFLENTFRVRTHGFFPASDDSFFMPFGDGPVTWPIPAARRMPIYAGNDTILRISTQNEAAVLMDWSRSLQPVAHSVMAFDESEKSRSAYFSFSDDAWRPSKDTNLVLDATLAWLRRVPQAYKAAWPHGYKAAHLIEMDTEDQFHSAPNFAKHLESQGLKGTFYCLTSEALRYPDIVRELMARGHEIAYHADVHFGFKGDPEGEQELRIIFMKQQMQTILGDRVKEATGFRAPTESYDKTTEKLLRKHGILHHAADESAIEDRLPFFSVSEPGVSPQEALIVLPRTQLDDVSFRRLKLTPEQVTFNLNYDLDLTVRSGGFGLLSVHTQNYVEGGLMLLTMGDYVRKVASYKDRLWVARGDDITAWWRQREAVKVQQRFVKNSLHVALQNTAPVQGLTIIVTLPRKDAAVRVSAATGGALVKVKPLDSFRAALVFDTLPAGRTQLRVDFR